MAGDEWEGRSMTARPLPHPDGGKALPPPSATFREAAMIDAVASLWSGPASMDDVFREVRRELSDHLTNMDQREDYRG